MSELIDKYLRLSHDKNCRHSLKDFWCLFTYLPENTGASFMLGREMRSHGTCTISKEQLTILTTMSDLYRKYSATYFGHNKLGGL